MRRKQSMVRFHGMFALGMLLATAAGAGAQVVGGVMSVTQSHMA
jgi:hypothetical protein